MNIVDALTVTLGLDDRQYREGTKRYREDRKRLADEDAKQNRATQDAQKRTVEGIRSLRNETAGFLFMLAGANSLKDFASNLLTGDAATGRLAKNLGIATEQVSAWEGAVKRVGGSSSDAQNALRNMASAFQSLQLMGTTGHDADFQGLGVTSKDLQNPSDALLKIAEASQRMPRQEFNARLKRLGFDENTINLLAKGRGEVTRMLEEQRKLGVTTDRSTEAAQRFQDAMAKIETGISAKLRPALTKLAEQFADWLSKGDNLNNLLAITGAILGGLALAAGAAYWPFLLLAGAIAVVVANLGKLKQMWADLTSGEFFKTHVGGENKGIMGGLQSIWGDLTSGNMFTPHEGSAGGVQPSGPTRGVSNGGGNRNASYVEQYFKTRGYTAAQARGIAAAVVAEGGLGKRTGGGYKGRALGVGQLLGPRRAEFLRRYGPNFTLDNELEFMNWELNGGDKGGAAVKRQTTAAGTLGAMIGGFYRPARGAETAGDLSRGLAHLGGSAGGARTRTASSGGGTNITQTTSIGEIKVITTHETAEGIATDIRRAISQRGLVVQANTGLNP